jgi:hypothetical protein
MVQDPITILNVPTIRTALRQAWEDSQPGLTGGHEEGGFVLRNQAGDLSVVRWPKGAQNSILLPPHPNCQLGQNDIIATFHTHPNTGGDYLQEPSETDKRAVRDDPDLKADFYSGEFVLAQRKIYLITPNGQVSEVGETQQVLA